MVFWIHYAGILKTTGTLDVYKKPLSNQFGIPSPSALKMRRIFMAKVSQIFANHVLLCNAFQTFFSGLRFFGMATKTSFCQTKSMNKHVMEVFSKVPAKQIFFTAAGKT